MKRQHASARIKIGTADIRAKVQVTPRGLVALGTCVSMILLGSAAIVVAARVNLR